MASYLEQRPPLTSRPARALPAESSRGLWLWLACVLGISCASATAPAAAEAHSDELARSLASERTAVFASASGWTAFAPSADTLTIYVSSSAGSDENDGLSPSKPLRTLEAGTARLRHGFPDWLLLKRGDEWRESLGQWKKSGRSQSEPMLVASFGDDLERPRISTGARGGIWTHGGGGSPSTIDNLALVGLYFHANEYTGAGRCVGAELLQPASHVLIEDCAFEGFSTNLVFQGFGGRHTDFRLRRSVVVDAYGIHDGEAHSQGLYAYAVDGLLIEENVFDHNGWHARVPGAGADIYCHNLYIDNDNSGVIVRGNIIANAASHGVQLRPGGTVVNNLFVRNSIALSVGGGNSPERGGVTADVRDNVILDGKDIDAESPRGWGMWFGNVASGRVERNVIANNVQGSRAVALTLDGAHAGIGVHDLVIEGNVLFDWGGGIVVSGDAARLTDIELRGNDVQEPNGARVLVEQADPASVDRVRSTGNRFFSRLAPREAWVRVAGKESSDASRRVLALSDAKSSAQPVRYTDPARSVASYNRSIGGEETFDAFLEQARGQSRTNWRPELMASALNNYARQGFDLVAD